MSQTSPIPNQRLVTELKVTAHVMTLEPGLYCVFHASGTPSPDPATGLPGVRITRAPATPARALEISTFNPDGWVGGEGNAALVRGMLPGAQILVTIYQIAGSTQEAPKLQVLRLGDVTPAAHQAQAASGAAPAGTDAAPQAAPAAPKPEVKPEVAAHVQRKGDVLSRLGEWMGVQGSQSWIEGFAISPSRLVAPADIEYQAVLGKGWLSPWSEGGQYCGSRGMALPILGLRVRLKGEASERYDVRLRASFTDGTSVGPIDGSETAESPDLAPLEAFLVEILPIGASADATMDAVGHESEAAKPPAASRPAAAKASAPARAEPAARATKARAVAAPVAAARSKATGGLRGGKPVGKVGTKGRR